NGEPIQLVRFRETDDVGWHRIGAYNLALPVGPQTHAVAIRPVGRTGIYLQSSDAGIVVAFDLDEMGSQVVAGDADTKTFVQELGAGWFLCAIGFDAPGPINDLRIGACAPESDTYEPYRGYRGMGFDLTQPMSVGAPRLGHPLLAVEFAENSDAARSRNQRAQRILSARRGFLADKKHKIALAKGSPKAIVIGASNVLFGVRAMLMERELGMPVANMG